MSDRILCPCKRCKRTVLRQRRIADEHVEDWGQWDESIIENQIREYASKRPVDFSQVMPSYPPRSRMHQQMGVQHVGRESLNTPIDTNMDGPLHDDDMEEMIEAFYMNEASDPNDEMFADDGSNPNSNNNQQDDAGYQRLRSLASTPLFEGSRATVLRTCLSMLNLQSIYGWSDASVSALFSLIKSTILPIVNAMPACREEAKKILTDIGMDYNSIHACPNDCILFRGEYANLDKCPKCQDNRYRQDLTGTTIPAKVLRHFPILPRIKHIFKCPDMAKLMTWHVTNRSTDNVLRIPADSAAWQHIEQQWPEFKMEPRHLRLGLAMDGVNPFGLRSTSWSTWPVVLVNYNIPPWLTIKKGHLLLALLVPGKYKVKNMDIYLAPLVDELQVLWDGIPILDVSRHSGQRSVVLRGILMWTMHDFPGYGECSGLATSGYHACPICGPAMNARYSNSLKKMVYQGHTRFLPTNHPMREGSLGRAPSTWTTSSQYNSWIENGGESPGPFGMKRLSIFHRLPYWRSLLINNLLDPMHIFKNVGQILWEHLIGARDNKRARMDLQDADILHMQPYWPIIGEDNSVTLPIAPWVLTREEEKRVKKVIASFRTPTGHMHLLKGAFTKDNKLSGLKTHDWHKFLQYILPTSIKNCTTPEVRQIIYQISRLVRWISQKEITLSSIEENRINAAEAICMLEKYFPTSILTIQVHLMVHIVDEVAVAGIVHSRWMFFLERFMKTLKGFVRQRARPEGSMAEGWLVQESLIYLSEFLGRREPSMHVLWHNKEDDRMIGEVPQGNGRICKMDPSLEEKVNRFCILNHPVMDKWVKAYEMERNRISNERQEYRRAQRNMTNFQFPPCLRELPKFIHLGWLHNALQEAVLRGETVTEIEKEFSRGCSRKYKSFGALWSHGRHFRVHRIDHKRQTFDSGVMASFEQEILTGQNDEVQLTKIEYCGRIQNIFQVDYRSFHMFLLDVQWFKAITTGRNPTVRRDGSGFVAIDSTKLWTNRSDTFVLAETCEQVIFQPVPTNTTWWYVIQVAPRSKQIYEEQELIEEQEVINIIPRTHDEPLDPTTNIDVLADRQLPTNVDIEQYTNNVSTNATSNRVDDENDEHQIDEEDDEDNYELETMQVDDLQDAHHVEDADVEYDQIMQNMGELDIFIDIFAHQDLLQDENYCNADDV